jgi:hypothetical protein
MSSSSSSSNNSQSFLDPSTVVSLMNELKNINIEIQRLNSSLKTIKDRKKTIEGKLTSYFEKQNKPGAKTQDMVVVVQESVRRPVKPKEQKEEDVISILNGAGVQNPKELYENIINAMKGEEKRKATLKIKDVFKSKK